MDLSNPIDTTIKPLFRGHPQALFRLVGLQVDPAAVRFEDTAINLAELRADQVFVYHDAANRRDCALYVEYQLEPDPSLLETWFLKCAGLHKQLGFPAVLMVIYLERGNRATFPNLYAFSLGNLSNAFHFETVRLWEHRNRIEAGELWELAPLLVLCENNPTEATLRREVELIVNSPASPAEQADLLAFTLRVGGRSFSRQVLEGIFREMLPMVQGATIIEDWIAAGEARGEAQGRLEQTRELTLKMLRSRFGTLSEPAEERVHKLEQAACEALFEQALTASSLAELDL